MGAIGIVWENIETSETKVLDVNEEAYLIPIYVKSK
jgi:hypothetical protein